MQYPKEESIQTKTKWIWVMILGTVFFSILVAFCMQPMANFRTPVLPAAVTN